MALNPSARMASVTADDKGMLEERKKLIDLMVAAKSGDKRVLRRTVRRLANSSDDTTSSEATVLSSYADGAGRTPLHFAANFGALGCASYIVDAAPESIKWTDNEGSTALHMASLGGHVDVVKFLLYTGALSNAARQNGDTALHLAALHNHVAVVAALIENGANVDATGAEGTPLWIAAREGNVEIVVALLAAGATVDAFNAARVTPLIAAAISNQAEVVEKLVEAKANVSFVGPAGITALHMAAEHGNVHMVKTLLAAPGGEAAAVLKEEHGLKPVELAAGNNHREVVDVLFPVSAIEGESVESLLTRHIELRRQENEAAATDKAAAVEVPVKPASEADQKRAAELKSEGNRAFVAKDYDAAMKLYSEGLALDPNNHALWSNRSACYKHLGDLDAALRDAERCIKVKPDWSKGYFRSGCVYEAQKRFEDASLAYWEAAKRDSGVKEYRASFQRALALAKEEYNAQQAAAAAGGASGDAASAGAGAGASTTGAGAGAGTAAASAEPPAAASATAASGGAPSGEPAAKS